MLRLAKATNLSLLFIFKLSKRLSINLWGSEDQKFYYFLSSCT